MLGDAGGEFHHDRESVGRGGSDEVRLTLSGETVECLDYFYLVVVITPALTTGPGGVEVAADVLVKGRDVADFVAKDTPHGVHFGGHFLLSVFRRTAFKCSRHLTLV